MSTPYDESQVISFEQDVQAGYVKAGTPINPNDPSYVVWVGRMQYDAVELGYAVSRQRHLNELYVQLGLTPLFPNPPSRSQIINVKANFCNLRDADDIPIYDGFIDTLITANPPKANDWASRLLAAGSTHITLDISGDYNENLNWAPRYPIPGHDWTNDLSGFSGVLDWCITKGFIPLVKLAADGQTYDPGGLTYGWQWGMNNIPGIISHLSKYIPYCLWSTGWDGCFPNWSKDQTVQFLRMLKAIDPNINISTEFAGPGSVGYCHMGNGGADWNNNQLDLLDAFEIEVMTYPGNEVGISQTATRLLGPGTKNAPITPYYLNGQKEVGIVYFETCAYQAIRKQITPADAIVAANQGAKYGFTNFGNGIPG
jgi:hypothetical protein